MTGPRSFREAFTEDPADVKDRARLVGERDSARRIAVALENRIAKVLALHYKVEAPNSRPFCSDCDIDDYWPCDTVAALTGGGDDARP